MNKVLLIVLSILLFASFSIALPTQDGTGLSWDGVANADGYYVYWRSDTESQDNSRRVKLIGVANTSVSFGDMPDISNPDNLNYTVTAYNASGNESGYSNEVRKNPLEVPGVPGTLRIE